MKKFHRPDAPPCDEPYLYRGAGLPDIYLCNGFTREEVDGEWFTHIEDLEGLHNAIALDLCAREAPLASNEFRFIRSTMDKTQAEIANAMGVDVQTVARWEKGKTPSGPADKMLRIMFIASVVGPEMLLEYKIQWYDHAFERVEERDIDALTAKRILIRGDLKDDQVSP